MPDKGVAVGGKDPPPPPLATERTTRQQQQQEKWPLGQNRTAASSRCPTVRPWLTTPVMPRETNEDAGQYASTVHAPAGARPKLLREGTAIVKSTAWSDPPTCWRART